MPARAIRRTAWVIGFAAGILALGALILPYAASTRLVGERIGEEMTAWSGLDVSIDGAPEISIWPDLKARLNGVTFSLPGGEPVVTADRVDVELSALAALRGKIDFSRAAFFKPTLHLDDDGWLPALPKTGRIAHAVEIAGEVVTQGGDFDGARLPADNFGTLEFIDGRVVRPFGNLELAVATALNGRINWATLGGNMSLSTKGVFRGEEFNVELSSGRPLLLLAGGASPATLSLRSRPANLSFDGTASLGDNPYAAGQASFSTQSVPMMLAWSGADFHVGSEIENVAIESRVMGDPTRIRFEDAKITLEGRPARGVLDLLLSSAMPKISGTLAFDTLDLGTFLSAFTPFDATNGGPGRIDADFASQLNMDLRLSAAQATLGAITLTDLAASARVDDSLATFDVSDATVFGGDVQAGLRFDQKPQGALVETRFLASDVGGEAFGRAVSLGSIAPTGRGTISMVLKGRGESWKTLLAEASGSFSASFGSGSLPGLDLEALLAGARGDSTFALAEVTGRGSQIEGLDVKAIIENGVARIEKAQIRSAAQFIDLTGKAQLNEGSLSLVGSIGPSIHTTADMPSRPPTAHFLVDGPLGAATVTPTKGLSAD